MRLECGDGGVRNTHTWKTVPLRQHAGNISGPRQDRQVWRVARGGGQRLPDINHDVPLLVFLDVLLDRNAIRPSTLAAAVRGRGPLSQHWLVGSLGDPTIEPGVSAASLQHRQKDDRQIRARVHPHDGTRAAPESPPNEVPCERIAPLIELAVGECVFVSDKGYVIAACGRVALHDAVNAGG
ncbi:MAG: hypothetical protein HW394_451 [Acidobacteria bacterium]|nr:hypothetical protein [Acidobacteriota bacterium]